MTDRWESEYFDEHYLTLHCDQTEEQARREAVWIQERLELAPGMRLLDLGCGHGRHILPLGQAGLQVRGIDSSPSLIERARARTCGTEVELVLGDFRTVDLGGPYDAILSIYTSFGYDSDEENEALLSRATQCLAPGGRLLLDLSNHDALVASDAGLRRSWRPLPDGSLLLDAPRYDPATSRLTVERLLVRPDGTRLQRRFAWRSYGAGELRRLLVRSGLEVRETWGGLDGRPLTVGAPRLVIRADRRLTAETERGGPTLPSGV